MAAQFCLLQIVVEGGRLFAGLNGQTIQSSEYPLTVGSTIAHWADAPRAAGWFKEAWRLLNLRDSTDPGDQKRYAALYAPVNTTDKAANNRTATEQFQYITDVLRAIARGYNLLNVVWHNDPVAREAYRAHLAGPPKFEGQSASGVFAADQDYNPAWYTHDEFLPQAQPTGGDLQQTALSMTGGKWGGKPGDKFAPSALLVLASMDPIGDNGPVALSKRVYNAPAVTSALRQTCPVGPIYNGLTLDFTSAIDFPWRKRCEAGSNGFGSALKAIMPDGTALPDGFDDWRAAYRGQLYQSDPVFNQGDGGIVAPLADYYPWLYAWAKSLTSRSPLQIIQDTRAYTAWQNALTLQANQAALQQIADLGNVLSQQQHAPDEGWNIAAGTLGVVAAVASAAGGVGAIVGLVAGAAAAVIKVTDAIVTKGTKGIGRDDLGRYKPQFERGWLSGNPAITDVSVGAPSLPSSELQDPPGEGTAWSPMDCPEHPVAASSSSGSGSSGGSLPGLGSVSGWWHSLSAPAKLGVGAVGVGGAFLLARSLQQPSRPERFKSR